jgi:hypothetical protein
MINWIRTTLARPWWTIFKMNIATFRGKPYFKVFIFQTDKIGNVGIDAHYNIHFLYQLDSAYEIAGSDVYNRGLDEQAKISIYLYDTIGGIAENYIPPPETEYVDDDIGADVPAMAYRGGEEVKQVIDLGKPKRADEFDIQRG